MKSLVLDANELAKDFMCLGLRYRLLEHAEDPTWVKVYIPAVVLEETVANYARTVQEALTRPEISDRDKGRLGIEIVGPMTPDQYRAHLLKRFDTRLGFTVLEWPEVTHEDLVKRAVSRTPPFDNKGRGYRDSLIWADVRELAQEGCDVVLVSEDAIFASPEGGLAEVLTEEVKTFSGTVTLTPSLGPWLLSTLPWAGGNMSTAVESAQEAEIAESLMATTPWDEPVPQVVDLGFERSPYDVVIEAVQWGGTMKRVAGAMGPDGVYVATYDLDFIVEVIAKFEALDAREEHWATNNVVDTLGQVVISGELPMVQRVAVLFGGEASHDIDVLGWRRTDGIGPGAALYRPEWDPGQPRLFEATPAPR